MNARRRWPSDTRVQVIESPCFAPLRLQLLSPHKRSSAHLIKCLYSILMLLPQRLPSPTSNPEP
jgi:hypothetical protein